jgi:hypothetical protein
LAAAGGLLFGGDACFFCFCFESFGAGLDGCLDVGDAVVDG